MAQDDARLSFKSPLGEKVLFLERFSGHEALSAPFSFELDLVSEQSALDFDAILGKGACITLARAYEDSAREFHGVVTRFQQTSTDARATHYRAELRPWFWLLKHAADHRIFQTKTVPQILEAIFSDLGYSDYRQQLTGQYEPREYCVQYGETYFDFASRLMEEEGIFYFFEHTTSAHTLVLADDRDAHALCLGGDALSYRGEVSEMRAVTDILECRLEGRVTATKYQSDDFNFEMPQTDLLVADGDGAVADRVYEYPGGYAKKNAGAARARARLQGLAQPKRQLSGRTAAAGLTSGYKFKLQGHPRADANAEYVLASVAHTAEQHTYENEFQAFPLNIPFRAARNTPKPRIAGAQTAIVVGKQGEEIWTDKYGRIKVKFHWDQDAARDENASCWVRVSQPSAGKQWGSMQVPRIGHEVVVSFLDGDPDRPLVTGRVYNADMMPPYTLPDNGTQWGWKSNSSKGGGGSNELRFEDKAGEEEVYLHAQHDLNVEVENEATAKITGNETNTNEADYSREVTGNYVLKITGDLTIEATGAISIKSGQDVACEAGGSMTNKAGSMLTNDAGASLMNKAVGALTNRAGGALTNAAGGVQTIGAGGMLVMGSSLVKIEPFNPT